MHDVYQNKTITRRRVSFDYLKNRTEDDEDIEVAYDKRTKTYLTADQKLTTAMGGMISCSDDTDIEATDEIIIDSTRYEIAVVNIIRGSVVNKMEVLLK